MTGESFIADLGGKHALGRLVELAPRGVLTLAEVRRVAEGQADPVTRVELGARWTERLVSLAERGGVGRLERQGERVVFAFADRVPDAEDAFYEATGPWPEEDDDPEDYVSGRDDW